MSRARQLIINADDFGFTRDVNAGIVEAHRRGILTAATLMATGGAFDDAVRLARENPELDVGCHLVLVGGRSVMPPHRPLPATIPGLVRAVVLSRIPLYDELAAQVRRLLDAGIRPSHLDTHKHTHLLPPVLKAVVRIAAEFGISWVRRPVGLPGLDYWLRPALEHSGCRMTDHFAGFRMTGRYGSEDLVRLIRRLPGGVTEFMCHPGFCEDELRAAPTRLKESRLRELEVLTAPETRHAIDEARVRLVRYRDL